MAGVAPVEGERPQAGDHCPRCGDGVLHLFAETDDGYVLHCFNCDTSGSIHKSEPFIAAADPDDATPTGFTVTHAQLAARAEIDKSRQVDVEQTTDRERTGSPTRGAVATATTGHEDDETAAVPHPEWGDPNA